MIKKIVFYLIAGIVTMLSACTDPDMGKSGGNTDLPDELTLQFSFTIPENTVVNTRSIDPDGEPISSIWLFLFNESGYYLGHVRANEVSYSKDESTGKEIGTFSTPSIPSTVRRIHFIANYNAADVDDSELLNRTEKEVMTRFTSSSGRLVYWGRKVFTSEDDLTSYFTNENSTQTLSPIILYRNQAAITYKNDLNLKIQGFAICNTYAKGTVVPYNHKEDDPFDFNLIEDHEHAIHDFVTLCSGEDLIKATDPEDTEVQNEWGLRYIFEHENAQDDPMFAIFKIDNKYYKLMIVDDQSNPYKIIRNHRYIFNFFSAPPTTLGYISFEEAKNGVAANDVWVSIDNELPSIGDGTSSLTIEGETTRIYTEKKDEIINFTCKGGIDQVTATWLSNEGLANSNLKLKYDNTTGKGSVTISLNEISDTPQYGTLQIKAGKYPRIIQIVYLNKFDFAPVWTSSSVPRRSGEPVSIVFNIPDTYPEELFPVECKISCNLFDANTNNQLEVIEEKTVFTIDGQTVERNWDYKYVYKADKPGLHRVDFKTLIDDYSTNPEDPSDADDVLTWFLEAPYFNTIQRTINMVGEAYADQKIIIYETTLGNQASGTYEREIAPIKGQTFDLKFYLEKKQPNPEDQEDTPAKTNIRIYVDETVAPDYDDNNWPDYLTKAKNDAPDAGRYFLYTVPDDATYNENNNTRYLVTIPFRTISAQCAGYARIAAASTDNEDPKKCYKSAIVTRVNNPEAYNFDLQANDVKELSLPYGTRRNVPLSISPNLGDHTVSSCEILIKTQNLEPADNNAAVRWDDERDGYVWTITSLSAPTYTLDMLTKDVVSAETVTISEISGNVAFYEDEITIKNPSLTGNIQITDYEFQTESPFIALEKSDGTRIGAFTVNATKNESTGSYTLTLRGEYDFTEDEELKVIYSPLEDSNVYVGTTTITELLTSPTLTLHLQQ